MSCSDSLIGLDSTVHQSTGILPPVAPSSLALDREETKGSIVAVSVFECEIETIVANFRVLARPLPGQSRSSPLIRISRFCSGL